MTGREGAGELTVRAAAQKVLTEFDRWASEPRPAADGGRPVRLHKFYEVQPEMERALDALRAALQAADTREGGIDPDDPRRVDGNLDGLRAERDEP